MKVKRENGKFPAYAWPGGYPIFYLTSDNSVLCPSCANKEDAKTLDGDVNYEDDSMYCDECGKQIESAYGDPEKNPKSSEKYHGVVELRGHDGKTQMHISPPYKDRYAANRWLRDAIIIAKRTGATVLYKRIVPASMHQLPNPAITKDQITETQRKRYAKRRKYTGATAPDQKKNPPKSLSDLMKSLRGAQATGNMKQRGHYFVQFRDERFAIEGSHNMIAQGLFVHEIRPSTAEAYRDKKNKPYIVEFTLSRTGEQINPPQKKTLIYGRIMQIKAQKTQTHHCDAACKRSGHRYVHAFKSNSQIYGLPNGDVLISNKKR